MLSHFHSWWTKNVPVFFPQFESFCLTAKNLPRCIPRGISACVLHLGHVQCPISRIRYLFRTVPINSTTCSDLITLTWGVIPLKIWLFWYCGQYDQQLCAQRAEKECIVPVDRYMTRIPIWFASEGYLDQDGHEVRKVNFELESIRTSVNHV